MFDSKICKIRRFERRHYYLDSMLVKKVEELAKKENTTRSKVVAKILKEKLEGGNFE